MLQNQLIVPFCLGLIVNILSEPTLLYIYENSLTQVENLSVRSDAIIFNLNGQDAFLPGNFSGFTQIQLCANGTHMNVGCQFSMASTFFCTWSIRDGSNFTYYTLSQFHSSVWCKLLLSERIYYTSNFMFLACVFQGCVQQLNTVYVPQSCPTVELLCNWTSGCATGHPIT